MDTTQTRPGDTAPLPGMDKPGTAPPAPGQRPVAARPRAPRPEKKEQLDRLSVPLTVDGEKIAYGVMQEKVKERLRRVLLDPDLPAAMGLTPIAGGGAQEKFPTDMVDMAFNYLSDAMVLIARKRGAPVDKAELLAFSPEEKKMLVEPAGRLLDKYFPGGLGKWGDEIMFGLSVMMVMNSKIAMLRAMIPGAPAHRGPNGEIVQFPQGTAAAQVQ